MKTRFFKVLGAAGFNLGIVGYGYSMWYKNHEFYKNCSEEEQKRIYNGCSEQKVSNNGDAYSTMQHRVYMDSPELLAKQPTIKPFKQPTK